MLPVSVARPAGMCSPSQSPSKRKVTMARNQLELFCSRKDLALVLSEVEEHTRLLFAPAGLSSSPEITAFTGCHDVLQYVSSSPTKALAFLVVPTGRALAVRDVPQKDGGTRYSIDQLANPTSIVLRPGHVWDERTLVAGQIGTASSDANSLRLLATFKDAVRKHFTRVKSYWVGPEAGTILDSGGRLLPTEKSPPEYDLRR